MGHIRTYRKRHPKTKPLFRALSNHPSPMRTYPRNGDIRQMPPNAANVSPMRRYTKTRRTPQKARAVLYPLTYPRQHESGGHLRIDYYIRPYYSAMFSHYPHISQIHLVRADGVSCIRYSVHLHTRKSKRLFQRPTVPERTPL